MSAVDYVTAVVVLVVAALVTGASASVVKLHAAALRASPSKRGLLSWHIVSIGSSVVGVWITLALGQLDILGWFDNPRWLRLSLYSVFGLLTLVALYIIAREQRLRVTRTPTKTQITEERGVVIDEGDG